jgi:hypothetical protein
MAGWHYGTLMGYRTPMGTWGLPSRVGDHQPYVVSADLSHTDQGTYTEIMNLSWDVWFGTNDNPNVPSYEMMVWPWYVRQVPDGTWQARIFLWGAQWDVYRGAVGSGSTTWTSVSFLRTTSTLHATGNLGDFIGYMQSRNWLPADARVIGIEFGLELVRGQGSFHFNSYSLEVAPKLAIALSDTNLTLSWNTNFTGFTLESVTQLGDTWVPVPGVTGYSAILPVSADSQFYRLGK